ncbi:5-formyltetrahydrofolate cyclo-ligase [Paenibacillus sp. MWE-103]|uniref:5-formyltetrahydrofolate cyclo-ligase n=1 Tax=Paenibacillus artemisiicola TaxID=1172618 RepID=A0ABS3WGG1_9BACL|nr:5-formyltetrahydrofolate cyclo-ligase [Paenibacillus artemisiicola]MBO7747395.1 5-formyltetrahydrofolate cyclo-ligase [Paenibacillus artemisiicola]
MNRTELKQAARLAARELRDGLSENGRMAWADTVCQLAVDWIRRRNERGRPVSNVMAYVPFRSELDTTLLIEWCWRTGLQVVVPRVVRGDRSMELYTIEAWDELAPGAYGIREPDPATARRCKASYVPDVVFVPGLAFDRNGGRLGYGGGYYDRFRDRLEAQTRQAGDALPPWIALGYGAQLVDEVPMDAHDVRVDAVLTERGFTGGTQHGFDAF